MQYLYMIICHMVNTHKLCLCTSRNRLFKANRLMAPPAKTNTQHYYSTLETVNNNNCAEHELTKSYLLTLLYLPRYYHEIA